MSANASPNSAPSGTLLTGLPAGRVLTGSAYEQSRRVWNGAVDHRPAVIVRPESADEVRDVVLAARKHNMALSVRSGGHDWLGRSVRDGGLVIDMSALQRVTVDVNARVATVQGGATANHVIAATSPHRLSIATGMVGSVGVVGLTLGGGYGPLNGWCGLAVDNLLSAEMVLADGRMVTVDASHEPELFWAIRGGGGNFGVVTSLRIRLHPVSDVLAGFVMYPLSQGISVWTKLSEILTDGPDVLTVQAVTMLGPDGDPVLFVMPIWSGEVTHGQTALDQLHQLGKPGFSHVNVMSYGSMLSLLDDQIVPGRAYAYRTRWVASYTPEIIRTLVKHGTSQSSPLSGVFVHHVHGASTRVPIEATAFGIRRPHFVIEILARWDGTDDPTPHLEWADRTDAALAPHALPGGYPNILRAEEQDQIAHAYGPNATRLCAAKARFDPDDVFSATPLPRQPQRAVTGQESIAHQ